MALCEGWKGGGRWKLLPLLSSSPPPQAVVEGVLQGAEQLRPAMEKLMQASEQHGYILQEEHCASCIALLRTHIQHLKSVPT